MALAPRLAATSTPGIEHLDRAIELHDHKVQGANRFRLGPNTGVVARIASGLLLWQSGAIEEGIGRVADGLDLAREIDHPYSIAYGLYHNGYLALGRMRFEESVDWARKLGVVAEENTYELWKTLATVLEGVSLTALGQVEQGLAMTEVGVEIYQGLTTPPIFWPLVLSLRAAVHAMAGNPERALSLIEEAIGHEPDSRMIDPNLLIAKGDFLLMLADDRAGRGDPAQRGRERGGGQAALERTEGAHPDGSPATRDRPHPRRERSTRGALLHFQRRVRRVGSAPDTRTS